jgi:hypothetical protein
MYGLEETRCEECPTVTPEKRFELVSKYFVQEPKKPVGAYVRLGLALFLFVVAVASAGSAGGANSCVAVLAAIGALVLLFQGLGRMFKYSRAHRAAFPRATESQLDAWLDEAIQPIVDTGREKLNIHPAEMGSAGRTLYLVFRGIPEWREAPGGLWWRPGPDGVTRYSAYKIMVIYLSDWRMPVYESVLDLSTAATWGDSTMEYGLNQVDGMETRSDRINLLDTDRKTGTDMAPVGDGSKAHFTESQLINLSVAGRLAVRLRLGIKPTETLVVTGVDNGGWSATPRSEVDKMISQLREHLRTRSGAAQSGNPGLMSVPPVQSSPPVEGNPGLLSLPSVEPPPEQASAN